MQYQEILFDINQEITFLTLNNAKKNQCPFPADDW